jgi:sugar phosphate isomerase/epimerase
MKNILACNLGSYGRYRERAWEHLPTIGVTGVELSVPPPADVPALQQRLADHGLTATTLMAPCPIGDETVVEQFAQSIAIAAEMGVKVLFTSVHAGEIPLDTVYARLRAIGDRAAEQGVHVAMETHPDLCHNGDVGRQTMAGVNHPHVGINFDTANIYYYNENIDGVAEFEKIVSHVKSLHLKDTNGGYRTWYFPTLGEGIVDFASLFRIANAAGMYGPFTMELEGIEGEQLNEEETLARVADSVAHLRGLGVLD